MQNVVSAQSSLIAANGSPVVGAGPVPSSASGHGQEDHISILCRGAIYREGDHGSDTIPDNETVLDVVDFSLENTLGDSITHYAVSCSLLEPRHCPPENARPLGVDDPGGTDWSWTGIFQRGPKRKQVYIWTCCRCGQTGNAIRHESCGACGCPRCAYCPVAKIRI